MRGLSGERGSTISKKSIRATNYKDLQDPLGNGARACRSQDDSHRQHLGRGFVTLGCQSDKRCSTPEPAPNHVWFRAKAPFPGGFGARTSLPTPAGEHERVPSGRRSQRRIVRPPDWTSNVAKFSRANPWGRRRRM